MLWYYFHCIGGLTAMFAALFATLLVAFRWRWFYIVAVTCKRDFIALWAYIKLLLLIKQYERRNLSVAGIFQVNVKKHPDKTAIISHSQSWTFRQLNEFSDRVAVFFHNHGYKKGDVVGLMLENRAEFVGIWLGLSKLGVVTSLINTSLRGNSLHHCINVANCSALIYGESFIDAIETIEQISAKLYQLNNKKNVPVHSLAEDLKTLLGSPSHGKLPTIALYPNHHDGLLYIYTSGTTGLPKAAVISHSRYIFIAAGIHYTLNFKCKDVYYTPLPLYHTAGGIMSVGQTLLFGSTIAVRTKFSASGYFADCIRFNCTISQYIGEMARYILTTSPSEYDRKHKIRMIFGNGLRSDIWTSFVKRFNIPKVGEFYGATEGNANIVNNDNTTGAVGFISRIISQVYPISLIRADPETGIPIRDARGLCQRCAPGETGVFIGKIIMDNPSRAFLGYVDADASKKKIIHDVFRKGDMAFLSGDLLTSDERGYLYFVDRTGDTFRWKGENVSTCEIQPLVSGAAFHKTTIVYGVLIPYTEGRAGMAAIYDPERELDVDRFGRNICEVLPPYARPQFIRLLNNIDITSTYKLRKVDLQREGYDPIIIRDPLYYRTHSGRYEILNGEIFEAINKGEIQF